MAVIGGLGLRRFDGPALRSGASVCLVVAVPLSLGARWAADSRDDSVLAAWLTLGALIGFVLGAGVAAWSQTRELPLAHGMVTAIGTYVVAQAVFITIRLVQGREVRWYAATFNVALVLTAGLVGGFLGQALHRRGVHPGAHQGTPSGGTSS